MPNNIVVIANRNWDWRITILLFGMYYPIIGSHHFSMSLSFRSDIDHVDDSMQ